VAQLANSFFCDAAAEVPELDPPELN